MKVCTTFLMAALALHSWRERFFSLQLLPHPYQAQLRLRLLEIGGKIVRKCNSIGKKEGPSVIVVYGLLYHIFGLLIDILCRSTRMIIRADARGATRPQLHLASDVPK